MRWIAACVAGEAIGICAVSMAYAAGERLSPGLAALFIIAAGAFEGFSLGTAQAFAGRKFGVQLVPWVLITITAGVVGYGLSLIGQSFAGDNVAGAESGEPPLVLIIVGGAALGIFMGAIFGSLQAIVAPPHVSKRGWIIRNTLGWAGAMAAIMIAASYAGADWPLYQTGALGAVAGAVAGLCVGGATRGGIIKNGAL